MSDISDDYDFAPSDSSHLRSLFDNTSSTKESTLMYTAPKQPRSISEVMANKQPETPRNPKLSFSSQHKAENVTEASTGLEPSPCPTQHKVGNVTEAQTGPELNPFPTPPKTGSVTEINTISETVTRGMKTVYALVVEVWKLVSGKYRPLGVHGLAIIASCTKNTCTHELLLYKDKHNVVTRIKICCCFHFFVKKDDFASFYDKSNVNWLVRFNNHNEAQRIKSYMERHGAKVDSPEENKPLQHKTKDKPVSTLTKVADSETSPLNKSVTLFSPSGDLLKANDPMSVFVAESLIQTNELKMNLSEISEKLHSFMNAFESKKLPDSRDQQTLENKVKVSHVRIADLAKALKKAQKENKQLKEKMAQHNTSVPKAEKSPVLSNRLQENEHNTSIVPNAEKSPVLSNRSQKNEHNTSTAPKAEKSPLFSNRLQENEDNTSTVPKEEKSPILSNRLQENEHNTTIVAKAEKSSVLSNRLQKNEHSTSSVPKTEKSPVFSNRLQENETPKVKQLEGKLMAQEIKNQALEKLIELQKGEIQELQDKVAAGHKVHLRWQDEVRRLETTVVALQQKLKENKADCEEDSEAVREERIKEKCAHFSTLLKEEMSEMFANIVSLVEHEVHNITEIEDILRRNVRFTTFKIIKKYGELCEQEPKSTIALGHCVC